MHATKQTSSSFKVGLLTIVAIIILIFTVLWIKGRSLSAGERIEVDFADVNGMRAGSGVQMMGLRVGQVEEITPIINGKNSYVKLKFVITEPNIKIPTLSTISIQQSGLIGEQFLEITPPKSKTLYVETQRNNTNLKKTDKIFMAFKGELKQIGSVLNPEIVISDDLPYDIRSKIQTKNALKIEYMINVAGLVLDNDDLDAKISGNNVIFKLKTGEPPEFPSQKQKFTVIEPMRISDFMNLQTRSAKSFIETNQKIAEVLNDDFIYEISQSVSNMNILTKKAITTIDKAQALIDASKTDIDIVLNQSEILISKLIKLTDNANEIVADKELRGTISSTAKSINRLSNNINTILEDKQSKEMLKNIDEITKNMAEISGYVNEFTKDENLKKDLKETVTGINTVTKNLNSTLNNINELNDGEKIKLKDAISDAVVTTRNLKTFSQKLNKRFLLFRLMF